MSVHERGTAQGQRQTALGQWIQARANHRLGLRHYLWPVADLYSAALAFVLAFYARYSLPPHAYSPFVSAPPRAHLYTVAFWLYLPTLAVMLGIAGAYRRPLAWTGPAEYRAVVQGVTYALLTVLMATYLFDRADSLARGWLLMAWLFSIAIIIGERVLVRTIAGRLAAVGRVGRPILIVGIHDEARAMEWYFRRHASLGLRVEGFIDEVAPIGSVVQGGRTVVGRTADLSAQIRARHIDAVLISARATSHDQLLVAVEATLGTPAEVVLSPDVFTVLSTNATLIPFPGLPVVQLTKVRLSWGERLSKGLFDVIGSVVLLAVLSPLLITIGILAAIKCGGVFERHTVLGLGGRPFAALKFRTTRHDVDMPDDEHTAHRRREGLPVRDDPRVVPYGRFLRRTSLDEWPQLWNVLRGQMSLVGPYKIDPRDLPHYGTRWLSVVTLKPGITGMAQVHGRGELTLEERSILDAEYVRNYSLWGDIALLLATLPSVARGRGAF